MTAPETHAAPEPREGEGPHPLECPACGDDVNKCGCMPEEYRRQANAALAAPTAEPPAPVQPEGRDGELRAAAAAVLPFFRSLQPILSIQRRAELADRLERALDAPPQPHADAGLREVLERVARMGAQAQAEAEVPGDPEVGKAWSGGYAQACRHILGDLRALLRSPASEAPAAPDAQEVRKLVRKAFCAGYLANGPTNPFEMEEKADRYTAIVCDPPRLDRIIRPTGALSARPAESEVRDG